MRDGQPAPLGPADAVIGAISLAGLLLLVVLGSAATDGGPAGLPLVTQYGPALLRAVVILVGIAEALVVLLVIWALWPDGERRGAPRARRSLLAATIATLVQLAAGLLLVWYLRRTRLGGRLIPPGGGVAGLGNLAPPAAGSPLPSGTEWLTAVVVAGVLALVLWRLRRTLGLRRRSSRQALAEQLDGAVARSISDLETDPDPRRAVIAAYGRMVAALADRGRPRRPSETAIEYLARILTDLEVPAAPVRRLTELFQFARFSPHEVDAGMRAGALAALGEIRAALPGPPGARAVVERLVWGAH